MREKFLVSWLERVVLCAFVCVGISYAQAATIYIDPTYGPGGNGSLATPYDSWNDVSFNVSGNTYLQKRGTECTITAKKSFSANNITLGAYGTGDRPRIVLTFNDYGIVSEGRDDLTFQDLEIQNGSDTTCSIYLNGDSQRCRIENCVMHGGWYGFRIIGSGNGNHEVLNCEIYDIKDDGTYISGVDGLEIGYCYFHHVNQIWAPGVPQTVAAGDGIQIASTINWYIHHNLIDRSDTGNKFCFIAGDDLGQDGCILEYNTFIGPIDTDQGGACVLLGDSNNLIVRYNIFRDTGMTGLWSHCINLSVHHNLFLNIEWGAIASWDSSLCTVYNNVFHNVGTCLRGSQIQARNNIFDILNSSQFVSNPSDTVETLTGGYNHFSMGPTFGNVPTTGDPLFVNPSAGDFHLQRTSPCRDTGRDVWIAVDADGVSIPQGLAQDKGMYEYYTACTPSNLNGLAGVDLNDLAIMAANWLLTGTDIPGDISGNGIVASEDLLEFAGCWLDPD